MRGINTTVLCGPISQPEIVRFSDGEQSHGEIVQFALATGSSYKKGGEWVNITEWHNIRIFNPRLIEKSISVQLQKGAIVSVVGRLQYDKWEEGEKTRKKAVIAVEKLEIIAKSKRAASSNETDAQPDPESAPQPDAASDLPAGISIETPTVTA